MIKGAVEHAASPSLFLSSGGKVVALMDPDGGRKRPPSAPVAQRCRISQADPGQLRAAPPCSLRGQPFGLV